MTNRQKIVIGKCVVRTYLGEWHRAQDSGERVTLASLYRKHLLTRRAWRKGRSSADDAYEYQATSDVMSLFAELGIWPRRRPRAALSPTE